MTKILVSDLHLVGSGLFSDSESFLDSMQDLSENELKMTFGGKKDSSKAKSEKSKTNINNGFIFYVGGICGVCSGGGTGGGGTGGGGTGGGAN